MEDLAAGAGLVAMEGEVAWDWGGLAGLEDAAAFRSWVASLVAQMAPVDLSVQEVQAHATAQSTGLRFAALAIVDAEVVAVGM